jgi:hypothetical protein
LNSLTTNQTFLQVAISNPARRIMVFFYHKLPLCFYEQFVISFVLNRTFTYVCLCNILSFKGQIGTTCIRSVLPSAFSGLGVTLSFTPGVQFLSKYMLSSRSLTPMVTLSVSDSNITFSENNRRCLSLSTFSYKY